MRKKIDRTSAVIGGATVVGGIALGAIALGIPAIADAAGPSPSPQASSPAAPGHRDRGHHFGAESELTGATAASVKAAVLAKLPGATVGRMSAEDPNEGTRAAYEAHVTKSDGTRVEVLLDKSFKVTAVNADRHGGRFGGHWRGGPPAGVPSTEAPSTGDSTSAAPTTESASV